MTKTDFDFFDRDMSEASQKEDQAVFETGNSFELEAFPMFDLGMNRYFQSIKSPVYDADGNIVEVQIVLWDVTTERIKSMAELAAVAAELAEARQRIKELEG